MRVSPLQKPPRGALGLVGTRWLGPPWKSPHRVRLAPSQECRENRKRHLRSFRCQLLTAERQAMNPPSIRNPSTSLAISVDLLLSRSVSAQEPAAAVPPMSAPAKPWEVDAQEWSGREELARTGRPLGAQLSDPGEMADSRWCGAPKRDRWRHHPGGEHRAQSCECSEKQNNFPRHITSLPPRHHATPRTQPS